MDDKIDKARTLRKTVDIYNIIGANRLLYLKAEKETNYEEMSNLIQKGVSDIERMLYDKSDLKEPEIEYLKRIKEEYLHEFSKIKYPIGKISLDTPITKIGLDERRTNAIFRALHKKDGRRIARYLGEAIRLNEEDFREPRKVGKGMIKDIKKCFNEFGFDFGSDFNYIRPEGD